MIYLFLSLIKDQELQVLSYVKSYICVWIYKVFK